LIQAAFRKGAASFFKDKGSNKGKGTKMPALKDIRAAGLVEDPAESERKDKGGQEIEVKSAAADTGWDALESIQARIATMRQRFEKKSAALPDTLLCKRCGEKFLRKADAEAHMGLLDGHGGGFGEVFDIVKDAQVEASDRILDEEAAALLRAQVLVQTSSTASTVSKNTAVADLMKCPFSMFEKKVKSLDLIMLEKFVGMRFDASTAMRKMIAGTELARKRLKTS
jgi:hypothetical protein